MRKVTWYVYGNVGPGYRFRLFAGQFLVGLARSAGRSRLASVGVIAALVAAPNIPSAARPLPTKVPEASVVVVVEQQDLGEISPDLFGSNLLWPYNAEGAFDPATDNFYPAFVSEVRQLGVTALRYPAGITADSFDWLRAIGPQSRRLPNEPYGLQAAELTKVCCELDGPVPSTVGPDEFGKLLDATGSVGDVIVNFATGTAQEAADFVAYMTAPFGEQPSSSPSDAGYWAALRAANGHPAPYDVPYWEVGNEQNGPYQFGWRSGSVISVGPHKTPCPSWEVTTCLYAFGGTTAFFDQAVGTFADDRRRASRSTGRPGQIFYLYFPPVVPKTQNVYVAGSRWRPVSDLAKAAPGAHVYHFDPSNGEITFGDGLHGAIPPRGAKVTASYQSGPHAGFVEFYAAMKKMSPHVHICETEQTNTSFLEIMGKAYPYDCVELHEYAQPHDTLAPLGKYEEDLMNAPITEGAALTALQQAIHRYSGKNIPVVLTEYGQLVVPMPTADPDFNLSLDEGLLVASQLRQWIDHGLPLAEKYLLNSTPFLSDDRVDLSIDPVGLSVDSAMIAGPGPHFVQEPTGEVLGLMSALAGSQRLDSWVWGNPEMRPSQNEVVPVLQCVAASSRGTLELLVINVSPDRSVATEVDLGHLVHESRVLVTVLDGPSPTAYNVSEDAKTVTTSSVVATVGYRNFRWMFPAHSVTLLQMSLLKLGDDRLSHQTKRKLARTEIPAIVKGPLVALGGSHLVVVG